MEYQFAFQLTVQMTCIMAARVPYEKDYHHVSNLSYQRHRNAKIVETSPILHKLSNVSADNFYEFAVVFYNYVIRLAEGFGWLDVVFDHYLKSSLEVQTRKGRGLSGTWVLQITDNVPFPPNFLCNADNKHDLERYLASKIVYIHSDVVNTHLLLCTTHSNSEISFPPTVNDATFQISIIAEEADQKII